MRGSTLETRARLDRTLLVDGALAVVTGVGVAAASGWLARPLGLATWAVVVIGVALVIWGVENLVVRRRPTNAAVTALVAADAVVGVAVLAVAITDPTGAETWMRWMLVALADVILTLGFLKYRFGLRPTTRGTREARATT